jgi:hypothetical protein
VAVFYFTTALFYATILAVWEISQLRRGQRRDHAIPFVGHSYFVLFIVAWLSYAMYIAIARFDSIAIALTRIPDLLGGFVTVNALVPYASRTSMANQLRLAANLVPALLVLPLLVFYGLRRSPLLSSQSKFALRVMPLALGPFAAITYASVGSLGYVIQYSLVLALIAFPLLALQRGLRKQLVILVVLAVATGAFAYAADENQAINFVTYEESAAASWLLIHAPGDLGVFTDYRLSGPLLGGGYGRTTGLSLQQLNASEFLRLFEVVYCARDGAKSVRAIQNTPFFDGTSPHLILFSTQMERDVPGIRAYGLGLRPCSVGFLGTFDTTPAVSKVYSDGDAVVYSVS